MYIKVIIMEVSILDLKFEITWQLCVCSVHRNGTMEEVYGTSSWIALALRLVMV